MKSIISYFIICILFWQVYVWEINSLEVILEVWIDRKCSGKIFPRWKFIDLIGEWDKFSSSWKYLNLLSWEVQILQEHKWIHAFHLLISRHEKSRKNCEEFSRKILKIAEFFWLTSRSFLCGNLGNCGNWFYTCHWTVEKCSPAHKPNRQMRANWLSSRMFTVIDLRE